MSSLIGYSISSALGIGTDRRVLLRTSGANARVTVIDGVVTLVAEIIRVRSRRIALRRWS